MEITKASAEEVARVLTVGPVKECSNRLVPRQPPTSQSLSQIDDPIVDIYQSQS